MVEIEITKLRAALAELSAYAKKAAARAREEARSAPDGSPSHNLKIWSDPKERLLQVATSWEADAHDADALAEATNYSDVITDLAMGSKLIVKLDFKVIRWLYKHKAPESVQLGIGSFPG